ncbi:hypothetical protein WA171_001321 [Blastocystis sp. BT1]
MIVVDCSINHLILFFTFFILSYSIQCSSNQHYVNITKYTGDYPSRESFEIVSGSSTLFSSPSFSGSYQQYVYEVCLNASSNHIYTLIMKDSASGGWYTGGLISMNDINDNTIFKNFMKYGVSEESYQFALYSPINKNDTWRYSDSYHSLWNTNSFNDNQWISIILGSSSITSYNTQYFRKSFNGITGMASIDIQFYYSHGIIAYINGIQVFRDNMPHGIINHSTLATNSYSYSSYRGIILPAFYAQFNQSVISVELHFTSVNERTIDFNSFISYQSGISTDNPCSIYPHSISSSGTFGNPSNAFDYSWNYPAWISPSSLPAYVIGSFETIIPLINSIRLYTDGYPDRSPSSFTVSGSPSLNYLFTGLFSQSNQTYSSNSWNQWSLNSSSLFNHIMFTVNSVQSTGSVYISELQFMTCNTIDIDPSPIIIPFISTSIQCSSNRHYVKITKKSGYYANQESFEIVSGSSVLFTSPPFSNNQQYVYEVCLNSSSNHIFTLVMGNSIGGTWPSGAWIEIEGMNGNIVYKGMMTEKRVQTEQFSLYSPINKNDSWKYTNSVSDNWKDVSYSDVDWSDVVTGSATQSVSGTQYFRKVFNGVEGMAAVEIELKYQYGIVAYLNGVEVYRDNMPDGQPSIDTLATGSYTSSDYHGVIRSASEVSISNVLSVEVHFTDSNHEEIIQFNGFLSLLAGMNSTNNCFVYPYNVTASSTDFDDPSYIVDWGYRSAAYSWNLPSSMMFDFSGSSIPFINSYRLWIDDDSIYYPSSFSIEGSVSTDDSWNMILSPSNVGYTSIEWNQFDLVSPHRYPLLRFTIHSSYGDNIELKELQFLVCNRPVSSIEYPETEYSFYKDYEQISISPIQYGFSDCSIQPSLPNGMSIDPNTCIISGVSHSLGSQQYTVTSTMVTPPIQSILNLTFIQCSGSIYRIEQTYMDDPDEEYFTIRDTSNESILFRIQRDHSHREYVRWTHYLCLNVDRFDVTFDSTSTYWSSGSYYYMYHMLPDGEEEMVVKGRYDTDQGNVHHHYVRRPSINHSEQWYYKMGEVPNNWFGDDTSGWSQAARGSFPTSTNRIQLYKKTFNIASLNEVSGLIVSIRYRYGVIVYLNGNEAWRNGVIGDLSTSSTVDNSYTDLKYYVVTLPVQ